jgi:hypothetical protein
MPADPEGHGESVAFDLTGNCLLTRRGWIVIHSLLRLGFITASEGSGPEPPIQCRVM